MAMASPQTCSASPPTWGPPLSASSSAAAAAAASSSSASSSSLALRKPPRTAAAALLLTEGRRKKAAWWLHGGRQQQKKQQTKFCAGGMEVRSGEGCRSKASSNSSSSSGSGGGMEEEEGGGGGGGGEEGRGTVSRRRAAVAAALVWSLGAAADGRTLGGTLGLLKENYGTAAAAADGTTLGGTLGLLKENYGTTAAAAADGTTLDGTLGGGFKEYYGTAASASSYGGFGGNASKRDTAEYVYAVPASWKERLISKVEKGTNGTDSEFFNPRRRSQKVYLTFLAGFSRLSSARDSVLSNLALSDVALQDVLASADRVSSSDRTDPASGQLFYEFEIESPASHSLISVTCANNKLYALFVNSPPADWASDAPLLRHIRDSFVTIQAPRS
jgi:hypothetical protein